MGRKQLVKAILFLFGFVPFLVTGQNYPRFELYQLKQGTDSGQFIVTGLDSNLAFNNILRFRSADSTFLIGTDTVAVKSDIPLIINDSLTARNFLTEEVDGSVTNELQTLSYNATTDEISISGGNSIDITEVNQNQNITLSGDVSGSGTTSITTTVADDSHNHIIDNVDGLQTALNSKLETEVDGSVSNEGSLTVGAGTASTSVISSNTNGSTDVTLTAGTNITLSETGNNITIAATGGDSSLWSEGATAGEIYYNSGNVGIGLTDPEYPLHVSGRGYFTDDLRAFDRIYLGGDFNHTSGSYAPYIDRYAATGETGMDFYAYNSGANLPLFRFFDSYNSYSEVFRLNSNASTYQIIANGDSDFNGDFNLDGRLDVNGFADFNSDQNASHDFGVGSSNYYPFMWVDASADKMAVGGGTPQYTLDVTGDINFTGDLYDNGSLVSFGGTTINNNADNRIITGSSTANTLNGENGLTWDGTTLNADGIVRIAYNSASGGGYYLRNTSTGLTSGNGIAMSLDLTDFYLTNYENADIILTTNNNANQRLILKNDGTVQFTAYGFGALTTDASGNISASDGRFKTVTRTMESGLDKVMKLKPLYYRWNEDSGFNTEFEEAGFIAQDVKKVIPEAVPNEEEENRKLNYSDRAIIATLTKAIQEQQEMIEELQKEIKRIKRKIK